VEARLVGLLLTAIFVKVRVQHKSVFAGGFALVVVVLLLLWLNGMTTSTVEVPQDSEAASVSLAL